MARRSEHSLEEIKAMVLDAAETIVIEDGFSALKVRTIAREIGYTVGSIYMVFENMADLVLHINARTLDAITAQLQQVQDGSAEESIEALALLYLSYAGQNFNRWRTVFDYRGSAGAEIPGWYQEKIDSVFAPVEARFAQLAPELADADRKRAARALWCGVHGICVLSLTEPQDKAEIKDVAATIVLLARNFMRGWVADSGRS